MDGIMVLLLEEIYLERQDGEEFVDIATDVLDAVLFPCPDFRRNVVKNMRNTTVWKLFTFRFPLFISNVFCNLQIEAWIIHENHTVWFPISDVLLAHLHIFQNSGKM